MLESAITVKEWSPSRTASSRIEMLTGVDAADTTISIGNVSSKGAEKL